MDMGDRDWRSHRIPCIAALLPCNAAENSLFPILGNWLVIR